MSDIEIVSNQLKFVKPDVKLSYFEDDVDDIEDNKVENVIKEVKPVS